jgi:hypothetical protein
MELSLDRLTKHYGSKIAVDCVSADLKPGVYGVRILSGAGYMPLVIQKMLELMPLVGSSADIFRTNTYHLFGWYIWSPYLLITVPILIGMGCLPFAVRGWARRMKV